MRKGKGVNKERLCVSMETIAIETGCNGSFLRLDGSGDEKRREYLLNEWAPFCDGNRWDMWRNGGVVAVAAAGAAGEAGASPASAAAVTAVSAGAEGTAWLGRPREANNCVFQWINRLKRNETDMKT